jgi:hypothetical protein
MITTILTIPALLFLAAHAFRMGSLGGAIFWLAAVFLAIAPVPWKSWALAGFMGFGAGLWGDITLTLVQHRIGSGLPWVRLAVILGAVTLLYLAVALMNWRRACHRQAKNIARHPPSRPLFPGRRLDCRHR